MSIHVHAIMRIKNFSNEAAEQLLSSIEPDNEGYVTSRIDGNELILKTDATSLLTMRSTLDDLLVCLSTAEHVINARKETTNEEGAGGEERTRGKNSMEAGVQVEERTED